MPNPRSSIAARACDGLLACAFALAAGSAQATPFELIYSGTFNSSEALNRASDSSPTFFTNTTPFTFHALFDDSSPNLAPMLGGPFNGFRAYAPTSADIDVAGARYRIETIQANPTAGVSVAIFDQNGFTPGHYGIGLIADPADGGADIIGDFLSASPSFTVAALTPTLFTDYYGVGHVSGVCVSGMAPVCLQAVTPWVLRDSGGVMWNLILGNLTEDYPFVHTPGASVGALNSAQILAVPEPSSYALMLCGIAALALGGDGGPKTLTSCSSALARRPGSSRGAIRGRLIRRV